MRKSKFTVQLQFLAPFLFDKLVGIFLSNICKHVKCLPRSSLDDKSVYWYAHHKYIAYRTDIWILRCSNEH